MNRIGNLVVPNDNYCKFEDWITPILNAMVDEQTTEGTKWTPSKMIRRLGKEINDPKVKVENFEKKTIAFFKFELLEYLLLVL